MNPAAYQYRICIAGEWGAWSDCSKDAADKYEGMERLEVRAMFSADQMDAHATAAREPLEQEIAALKHDVAEYVRISTEQATQIERMREALQGLLDALPSATTHPAIAAARTAIARVTEG